MSTRSERDKQKALQERHQAILAQLLKDEDNKYCVDCDAKGLFLFVDFFLPSPASTSGQFLNQIEV